MGTKQFGFIFFVLVAIELLAMHFLPSARWLTKPLIVGSLLIWYVLQTKGTSNVLIIGALLAAILGDLLLLANGDQFFLAGIGAFLLMQIFYSLFFIKYYSTPRGIKLGSTFFIIMVALLFNFTFFSSLGDFKIPVMIYSLAITIMVVLGNNQHLSKHIATGALLFMISDLTLAYGKFVDTTQNLDLLVMITYAAAQFYIIKGIIEAKPLNHDY